MAQSFSFETTMFIQDSLPWTKNLKSINLDWGKSGFLERNSSVNYVINIKAVQ